MGIWNGFEYFTSGVISPNIWVVIAPTGSGGLAQNIPQYLIDRLNGKGIFVAGVHWKGCDFGEEDFGARYFSIGAWIQYMQATYGLTTNPVLYAQSRGGLQLLNFACEAPSLVTRVGCLYPAMTPESYPGRGGALSNAHNKSDAEFDAVMSNGSAVISRYTPNAKASGLINTPTCIWHGDSDTIVPKSLNTDIFAPLAHAYVKTLIGFGHETPSTALMDEMVEWLQWGTLPTGAVQQ